MTFRCGHPKTPENSRKGKKKGCASCHREGGRKRRERLRGPDWVPPDPNKYPCGHPRTADNTRIKKGDVSGSCRTCHRGKEKARRERDPERFRARAKAYAEANRDARNAYHRAWEEDNREHVRAYKREYERARRLRRHDTETIYWLNLIAGDPCAYCGGPMEAADHIQPRSRGGTSDWTNYTAACGPCNRKKWAHPLLMFLLKRSSDLDCEGDLSPA